MKIVRERFALLVLVGAFIWSAVMIATRRTAETPKGVSVIRIGHWQLEGGVRDGFNKLADEFSKLPAIRAKYGQVRIVQDSIPESIYPQWVSTQMMGGTAPDLLEIGMGLSPPIWLAYQNRYFFSLSDLAASPNPFNVGTPLEGMPLKNTFSDGMRSGYQEELQQYMRVPLSRFTARVFYNKDLLKKLTGLDHPPADYRGFLDVCQKIAACTNDRGQPYIPISSSKYHVGMWQGGTCDPLTYPLLFQADFNRDGSIGNDETFVGFRKGVLSFDSPPIKARFRAVRQLNQQSQTGFTGLTRDEAVFPFAQQRAVFISTGTWDVSSLVEQANGKFSVGVMNFPHPTPDDPEYGKFIYGPNFDPANQGFPFGVTRFSKNPDLAKDFLLYLSSAEGNRKLNEAIGWIPSVIEVPLPPLLRDFKPVNQGVYPAMNLEIGGDTSVRYQQLFSQYQNDEKFTYDDFAKQFGKFYETKGLQDWQEQQRDWRRSVLVDERWLTAMRGEAMLAAGDAAQPDWIRYRIFTAGRLVSPDIRHAIQQQLVVQGPSDAVGPYEYRPEALARVRADLKKRSATQPSAK